ncbi:pyrroloquinoline quinone biosynthesis peptide chaperone PqqD [Chimaeribacter arupi]|jgi:pyrroloquinoline quinone biosynthesis protein D|uniref:PqqA binding protein n=2 Tax=Yersiniaceae TaxID=1903411 RepID=A0A2N5EHY0_9GAMM|nr:MULTISPECIES: pyrroloquinoline quinone biosynthesis peptide chaperone PqqD [Yersiniaceae]MBS0969271.1 pyrroloquinoline quinone biosynthesis peptide chaperone PqqD [Nissabacter archeti]MDV5142566.1 pyrroloquinoline quinone biosynthesis peptide chaperone PqqD [Chimaeribacter arupi]PLR34973.1 pyrroloquinoline quinone biosynthesis peptide chaperone PqqD [Chimaeribacter arupi]PLR42789.1 pyrroloquinoline quinone biosynthesis peptide chaperone PqqD [Chimaeribacter arupi]PLR44029.1 pyrroloquinoline
MIEINVQSTPVFRRGYRLQWEKVQDCHVILYPEGMAKLNESATAILQLVDGKQTVAEIIAALDARFPDAGGVGEDVKEFFISAYEQKWIMFRE